MQVTVSEDRFMFFAITNFLSLFWLRLLTCMIRSILDLVDIIGRCCFELETNKEKAKNCLAICPEWRFLQNMIIQKL